MCMHDNITPHLVSRPLFTKWTGALPPNLVKPRSHDIGCYNHRITLKSGRYLGNAAADVLVKFTIIMTSNSAALRLHEIWQQEVRTCYRLLNTGPV